MEEKQFEEVYDVLDELNSRIEEIIDEYQDVEARQIVISKLNEKAQDFLYEFQEEVEKLDIIEMVV